MTDWEKEMDDDIIVLLTKDAVVTYTQIKKRFLNLLKQEIKQFADELTEKTNWIFHLTADAEEHGEVLEELLQKRGIDND